MEVPTVRIFTLGRFLIEVDGTPLRFEAKAKRKPLDLLKIVVALGGDSVPSEQIIESLWPDSDGDRAHSAFTTNLGRLRKLIGAQPITLQNGRLSLDERSCWLDTWAFAAYLRDATTAANSGDAAGAWEAFEQAMTLYRGPFLDGEYEPAELLSARERLHGQFLRHIERMGELLCQAHDYPRAAELFQRGLEVDDLSEELYQQLMRCYLVQGRLVEGVGVYKRCKQIFRASVGIDPSPETDAIYQELLAAQSAPSPAVAAVVAPPAESAVPMAAPIAPGGASGAALAPTSPAMAPVPGAMALSEGPVATAAPSGPVVSPPATPVSGVTGAPMGERRPATAVCCLIQGYASMTAHLDPEELDEFIVRFRTAAAGAVQRYGGTVNEFVREELFLLFGIPAAHEDDPVRAVRAVKELQVLIEGLRPQVQAQTGEALHLSAGIATGLMIAHSSEGGGHFDATGEPMTLCAALAAQAGPDEILVGPETSRRIAYFFEVEAREAVEIVGRPEPLPVYRVTGQLDVQSRFEAATRRGLTRFTGRDSELEVLANALQRACDGEGQLVTVVGEAGLGKSRLLHEFKTLLNPESMLVLECDAESTGADTPYLPFRNGLRRGLQLRETDTSEQLVRKVVGNIRAVDPALEPYLPYYLYLLSIPSAEHPLPTGLSGDQLRQAVQEAIVAVGVQTTKMQPMVLLFEDWHWVDDPSMETLRRLVGMMGSHRLMIVVTSRPEYAFNLGNLSYHTDLQLKPLNRAGTGDMVASVLGVRELPAGLAEHIHERTGGNPFFIEEVCSALREEGAIEVREEQVVLRRALDAMELPDTVQAVIRTRVDRLDGEAQQTLRLASVIGREFGLRLLQRIVAQDVHLELCLERLKDLELIQQTQVLPDPSYRFKHALTQVVVYETLLRQQRRKLHEAVGEALEELFAGRLEEHYEALAYHFQRSNDADKALHYLERAGDKSEQAHALESARTYFRSAVELVDARTLDDDLRRKRIDLSLKWARVSQYSPTPSHIEVLGTSMQLANTLGDWERQATVIYWRGRLLYVLGHMRQALHEFEQVAEHARALGHDELMARYTAFIGRYSWHMAEYERSIDHLERAVEAMSRLGFTDEVYYQQSLLGTVLGWIGRFDEGYELLQSVVDRARDNANPTRQTAAMVFLAMIKALRGDWAEAVALATAGYQQAESLGNVAIAGIGRWTAGYANFHVGAREEGLELLDDVPRWPREGRPGGMLIFPAWHAEMLALAGRTADAVASCEQALAMPEGSGHRNGLPTAWRAMALTAVLPGGTGWEDAVRHFETSLRVAEELQALPEGAITRFYYAEQLQAHGNPKAARAQIAEAEKAFDRLGMAPWLERAKALRQSIGGR